MPQLFQVLRCYKCLVFQVHQTKKSDKFQCKMCGEKQSIKRHYGIGNGQECRLHVQKLNVIRGNLNEEEDVLTSDNSEEENECEETKIDLIPKLETSKSKWSAFVNDENNIAQDGDEVTYSYREEITYNKPKRKKYSDSSQNNILSSQKTSVNKMKFETPYRYNENVNQTTQEQTCFETSDKLVSKQKCDGIANSLNTAQGPVKGKSKWAQFVEEQEELEQCETYCTENKSSSNNTNNLFELCDDTDLDVILNI